MSKTIQRVKGPTSIAGALASAIVLLAGGCGGSDGTEGTQGLAIDSPSVNTERPVPEPADDGRSPVATTGGTPRTTDSRPSQADRQRAAAAAEDAYSTYIDAIDERDGETICLLLPADARRVLKPPVDRGGCAESLSASIGYRDPRGYPVWRRTTLTGIEGSSVGSDLATARLTAGIVTEFADRTEPSIENDIVYMEQVDGEWRLAKPSSAIYRAIGRPEPPPDVISPP